MGATAGANPPMHVAPSAWCHRDAAAFTRLAGLSLNTVTLSHQHAATTLFRQPR